MGMGEKLVIVLVLLALVGCILSFSVNSLLKTERQRRLEEEFAMERARALEPWVRRFWIGLGGLVLLTGAGLSFALIWGVYARWASVVSPAPNGLFPLIQRPGRVLDPNIALTPVVAFRGDGLGREEEAAIRRSMVQMTAAKFQNAPAVIDNDPPDPPVLAPPMPPVEVWDELEPAHVARLLEEVGDGE